MRSKLIGKGAHCVVERSLLLRPKALGNVARIGRMTSELGLVLEVQVRDLIREILGNNMVDRIGRISIGAKKLGHCNTSYEIECFVMNFDGTGKARCSLAREALSKSEKQAREGAEARSSHCRSSIRVTVPCYCCHMDACRLHGSSKRRI